MADSLMQGKDLLKQLFSRLPDKPKKYKATIYSGANRPNAIQQADLLFLPSDKGYKYALVVVDIATRRVAVEPLKSKTATATAKAIEKIYDDDFLTYPTRIEVDPGSEFRGQFKRLMEDNGTDVRYGLPERHRSQCLVERINGILGKKIFIRQMLRELTSKKVNKQWVSELPEIVGEINSKLVREPIALTDNYPEPSPQESNILPIGTKVRVKLDTPEDLFGNKLKPPFRATDFRWSRDIHKITKVIIKPMNSIRYLVSGIQDASYARHELLPV